MNIHPIIDISIHAPREGCDWETGMSTMDIDIFQSTHPVRGATGLVIAVDYRQSISIHAPREGCDLRWPPRPRQSQTYFNPRTP